MDLRNVTCPRCGGLPHDPRMVHHGDAELVCTATHVFTFTGEHPQDWNLERHLTAPDHDGSITLTCSDCDRPFIKHAAPPRARISW